MENLKHNHFEHKYFKNNTSGTHHISSHLYTHKRNKVMKDILYYIKTNYLQHIPLYNYIQNVQKSEIWETYFIQHTVVITSSVYILIWPVDGFSQNTQPSYSSSYINWRSRIKVICHFIYLSYYIQIGTSQSKSKQCMLKIPTLNL